MSMDWYYAGGDKPLGPVSEADFNELLQAGTITLDTLVWKTGMPDWKPLRSVLGSPGAPPAPPVIAGNASAPTAAGTCTECGQVFPHTEMISVGGAWVCARCKPLFVQRLREGAPLASPSRAWRDGKSLVMAADVILPSCCAKCNAPVSRDPIKRTLYWHAPWIYLLILISILIYIIVAIIVRKKAVVFVPVCEEHRRQRYLFITASWLLSLTGIALWFVAASGGSGYWVLAGLILFFGGLILGVWKGTLVSAKKIDDRFVWVRGFCPEYLAQLPEWRGIG